ncbi:MAG TPA: sulfurtransferase [Gammaproteobacteria bacterium]|nr:sulfurtransferase [Gammaproteobacteria bacterium]
MVDTLVTAEQLVGHLDDPQWVVFDCRFELADPQAGERAWREGHIPGARFADLERDLSGPTGPRTGRHPLPDPDLLAGKLAGWGVGPQSQIVAYDDRGGAFAARLWWLARWLGHSHAAVLDGGLNRWRAEGRPLDQRTPHPVANTFKPQVDHDLWLRTDEVEEMMREQVGCLIDARDADRYAGKNEPVDPVAGHIPGAINLPFKDNLDSEGRFRSPDELAERFHAALGGTDPAEVVHSCGSGVTACHNLLAMEVAGLRGSRLYAGSFSEWIRDPGRAVETGGGR